MKSFVTGATGFVGSHLVEALLGRGDRVTALVRSPSKSANLFGDRVDAVAGSLDDADALAKGCDGADLIFHVAALTAARSRREFYAVNDRATARLLDVASRSAPDLRRFVYVSSLSASGPATLGRPRVETDPPRPVSDYGASKLAGETRVRASGLPWTILRAPAVYGPRDLELFKVFRSAARGFGPVFGSAGQELSLVYVADLADALLAATAEAARNRVYFATHPDVVTSYQLLQLIGRSVAPPGASDRSTRAIRIPAWLTRVLLTAIGGVAWSLGRRTLLCRDKSREFVAEAWTCTADAMERETGWKAGVPLVAGLARTAAWYREAGWL